MESAATFQEHYKPDYAGPFLAGFALASLIALLALVLLLVREVTLRRACACAALVIVAVVLAFSCVEVLHGPAHMEALLKVDSLSECNNERFRHAAYGEARATAGLALWAAPFALVVATLVTARSLASRIAWLAWAALPWALFAATGCLYLRPLPGPFLTQGECYLYEYRDAILGSDEHKRQRACVELHDLIKDPPVMRNMMAGKPQETVLPELPRLKRRCLDDIMDMMRQPGLGYDACRADVLHSPFLDPTDRPDVLRILDQIPSPRWCTVTGTVEDVPDEVEVR